MATVIIQERLGKTGKRFLVYYNDPLTGRRVYHKSFKDQKKAIQEEGKLRALIDEGRLTGLKGARRRYRPMTLALVLEQCRAQWLERQRAGELQPRTRENYLQQAKMVEQAFGPRLLFEITAEDIRAYCAALAQAKSACTANRRLFIIKQIFRQGLATGAVAENPAAGISYLSEKKHERNSYLLPGDIDRLLAASRRKGGRRYLPALILLAVEYGASTQELLGLTWRHVNFEYGTIRFYRSKNRRERTLRLTPRCQEALLAWRGHLERMRRRKRVEATGDHVFCHLDGRPLKSFRKAWNTTLALLQADGDGQRFQDYHFHDNRHTFSSNILFIGGTLKDAKEMIGHADTRMTNRYAHLDTLRKQAIQERLTRHYEGQAVGLFGWG